MMLAASLMVALVLAPHGARTDARQKSLEQAKLEANLENRKWLKGLGPIELVIEPFSNDAEFLKNVETVLETNLSAAGITYTTAKFPYEDREGPVLRVVATFILSEGHFSACLIERTKLKRADKMMLFPTWKYPVIDDWTTVKSKTDVVEQAQAMVDKFCNDYLTMNPKKG